MIRPKNVEIVWKSTCKYLRTFIVNLCVKHKKIIQPAKFSFFPPSFPFFPTDFLTTPPPHKNPPLFHFFTDPTITTINII